MTVTNTLTKPGIDRWPAVRTRHLWRNELRLQPWTLLVTTVLLGAAWAVGSRLDTAFERSLLAVVTTVALSTVLDDVAAAMTAASPTPLVARRLVRATVAVAALAAPWAVIGLAAATFLAPFADTAPWWADVLVWAAMAASQLTLGAVRGGGNGGRASTGPGVLLALAWITLTGAPRIHERLNPVSDHAVTWCAILAFAVVTFLVTSTDPANRGRVRSQG